MGGAEWSGAGVVESLTEQASQEKNINRFLTLVYFVHNHMRQITTFLSKKRHKIQLKKRLAELIWQL